MLLRFNIDALVVVFGVHDHREIELLGIGLREARVAVGAPLHGRAHAVAVAQIDIVAHANLIAVVEHRRPGQRKQQAVEEFHLAPVVASSGARRRRIPRLMRACGSLGIGPVHVIALFIRDHFQGQFVMIAQKDGPLAGLRNRLGLLAGCR